MRSVKTTFSASENPGIYHTVMFNEMSINHVNLPNNECFMIHSITKGFKSTFPLPKFTNTPLEEWRFAFSAPFHHHEDSVFEDKRRMKWNRAWLTMLRPQAAENSLTTSGAAKKVLFSSSDNCSCWI